MSNAAQTAALAAFNRDSNTKSDHISIRKPKLNENPKSPRQLLKSPDLQPNLSRSPIPTPQLRKPSGDSLIPQTIEYTPSQSSYISASSDDYFNQKSAGEIRSPYTPQEMINNVKQSISLKALQQDPSSKRLSSEYSPQEMLKNLKASLQAKAKSTQNITDKNENSHLNEMRDHLDNTVRIASSSMSSLRLNPDLNKCISNISSSSTESEVVQMNQQFESPTPGIKIESVDDDCNHYKLKRKPPPGLESAVDLHEQMQLNAKSNETFSSGASITLNEDEDEESDDIPKFPDIKKHKRKQEKKNNDYLYELSTSDENLPLPKPAPLTGQQQPVQFRTTMRKDKRRDRKSKFDEFKPWKSHNDLNYLTDSEKKRYEGVWVSNKGNYINCIVTKLSGVNYDLKQEDKKVDNSMKAAILSDQNTEDLHSLESVEVNQLILGSVVKRIWKRSRLPNDTLEQIWNLVDFRKDGTLNKNEFLVGMWLVDQCLYGRKLPKKVDDIVWQNLSGIGVTYKKR